MDMIERVARVICEAGDYGDAELIFAETVHRGDCTKENFTCAVCIQDECRAIGLAAIAAMREPTEKQLIAAMSSSLWIRENGGIEVAPLAIWQAMIDAPLSSKVD